MDERHDPKNRRSDDSDDSRTPPINRLKFAVYQPPKTIKVDEMASFKYLIFISLAVLSVYSAVAAEDMPKAVEGPAAADENSRVKKHAYVASPVLAYQPAAAYPYAYSAYAGYPYAAYPYAATYPAAAAAAAYPAAVPYSAYTAYPSYAYDDGKYYPGKYEKTYYPAYKTAYPTYYHY